MKFVVTGSTGNISKPLTRLLVNAGHEVLVISSDPNKTEEVTKSGAHAAIGSIEDLDFLTQTFAGADGVYTMIPPKLDAPNWKAYIHQITDNYVNAIKATGIKKVVQLSAFGADVAEDSGLLSIYYGMEQKFNTLDGISLTFLRPGSFYTNFYNDIATIKHFGIIGNNYGELSLPLADPRDIAAAAAEELQKQPDGQQSIRYVVSDEKLTSEIAAVLGAAIGKPDLQWVKLKEDDIYNGMVQHGITDDVAKNLLEMGRAVERGAARPGYLAHKPTFGTIKLEDFAKDFAQAYRNS